MTAADGVSRRQLQPPSLAVQAIEVAARVAELQRLAASRDPSVGIVEAFVALAGYTEALARIVADAASTADTALELADRAYGLAASDGIEQ